MVEPSGHCPYLGLKQNQAIRFASPTPEHRCYATGQAQDIPTTRSDYQATLCLSSGHVRCPLYTRSGLPSTPPVVVGGPVGQIASVGGLRGWFAGLTPRDRGIYLGLLTLLLVIFSVYTVAGVNLLRDSGLLDGGSEIFSPPIIVSSTTIPSETPSYTATTASTQTPTGTPTATDTSVPTATDTYVPNVPPTDIPPPTLTNTASPLTPVFTDTPWFEPTISVESPTVEKPTSTAEPPTVELPTPTAEPPTVELPTPTAEPPTVELPTPTAEPPTVELPTTEPPTAEPPTAEPPTAEPPTAEPPTRTSQPEISRTNEPQPQPTPNSF